MICEGNNTYIFFPFWKQEELLVSLLEWASWVWLRLCFGWLKYLRHFSEQINGHWTQEVWIIFIGNFLLLTLNIKCFHYIDDFIVHGLILELNKCFNSFKIFHGPQISDFDYTVLLQNKIKQPYLSIFKSIVLLIRPQPGHFLTIESGDNLVCSLCFNHITW